MKALNRWLALLATVLLLGCGEEKKEEEKIVIGDHQEASTTEKTTETGSTDSPDANEDVIEIRLTGNDQMRFNLEEIHVKEGQRVRLILEHVGQLPENVMGHNFVLLEQGTDLDVFAQKAAGAKENDYIPEGSEQVIAHTETIGGGEETSIEFEAPPAGTYDFICSFPGHYMFMQGKFIVE